MNRFNQVKLVFFVGLFTCDNIAEDPGLGSSPDPRWCPQLPSSKLRIGESRMNRHRITMVATCLLDGNVKVMEVGVSVECPCDIAKNLCAVPNKMLGPPPRSSGTRCKSFAVLSPFRFTGLIEPRVWKTPVLVFRTMVAHDRPVLSCVDPQAEFRKDRVRPRLAPVR